MEREKLTKKDILRFKEKLLAEKAKILNGGILRSREDLTVTPEDLPDEADVAANIINQQVSFSMRSREIQKLRSIEEALMRIQDGYFGSCEECEEFIGMKRLENRPWAELCITHAEEKERETRFQFL